MTLPQEWNIMNWKKECELPYLFLEKKEEIKSLIKKNRNNSKKIIKFFMWIIILNFMHLNLIHYGIMITCYILHRLIGHFYILIKVKQIDNIRKCMEEEELENGLMTLNADLDLEPIKK